MTYDDIQKKLASHADRLGFFKKDISKGQIQSYITVSNELIGLGEVYRSLGKMLDKQKDKIFRRKFDNVEKSTKELQDIVSDSISKPDSCMKVTNRIVGLIADLNDLLELMSTNTPGQPKDPEAIQSVILLKKLLEDESNFSDMPRGTRMESWEWIANKIKYPTNPVNTSPRHKRMQGYLRGNCPKLYKTLKRIVEKN